ncbi:MAG TPA: M48 family metallopeptidase [Thiobacillaceae bacterium]|nr:M48 family metallopeptidase [Thiobacillaceae bacterium]
MNEFDILLFAPHLPARGEKARARFSATHLEVDGQAVDAPVDTIGVTLGGFDHKQLYLFWHQEEGRWAMSPQDAAAQELLIRSAPAPLNALLQAASKDIRRHKRRLGTTLSLLALGLMLPLLLAGFFFAQSGRIAGWVANHISIEQEMQLGKQAFQQATRGLHLRQSGADWQAVAAIGNKLTAGSRYTYHWYIADDPAINAFAVPGGYVVVNRGLIKAADSAEEVAGVLAHEVQHVEQRHTLKNLIQRLGWRALVSLAAGDVSGSIVASAAANLGELKFSRDLEAQADLGGLAALRKAGISPQGMLSFFTKLAKQDGSPVPFLSTHPASAQRLHDLQAAISREGEWPASPLPYDWTVIKRTPS